MPQFTMRAGRAMAAAAFFGAFLSAMPLHESHAQQTDQAKPTMVAHAKHMGDGGEVRIKDLHDKLQITAEQEVLWGAVAQAMRDNGKSMQDGVADRSARLKDMTAVDDLKSFQVIADRHAEGLKQLIPAFEALYANMSSDQQKRADRVFGEHQRHMHM